MASFRLAHLSDAHIGAPETIPAPERNLKRAIGWLNWYRRRRFMHLAGIAEQIVADIEAQSPDHIAFTGDYANVGASTELQAGARWLARLGAPEKVSVVPGNHDIYSRRGLGADLALAAWRPYFADPSAGATASRDPHAGFPFVRRLGPVAIVGVNSAIPTPPFLAWGEVGDAQLRRLEALLGQLRGEGLVRVVLIHHPPLPGLTKRLRNLRDAPALAALLHRIGAELVLYGHNHRDTITWAAGQRPVPVVGVASASLVVEHGRQPRARYNLIQITPGKSGPPHIAIERRGLAAEGGPVQSLERIDLSAPPA